MQQVEAGVLSLDDPVVDALPRDIELGTGEGSVTIHDLLTHSSGIPADGMAYVLLERNAGIAPRSQPLSDWDDFYDLVEAGQAEATDPPGERYFYYNSGYTLLGQVVEAVTGTPFREYVTESLLEPLGMTRSTFERADYETDADAATPYVLADGALEPTRLPVDELFDPPGGLLSSARELATYLRCCLGEGSVDDTELVSPDAFDTVTTGYVPVDWRRGDPGMQYGYGWTVDDLLGHRLVGHEGNLGVSSAYLGFLPEADLGIAVLANAGLYSVDYELDAVGRGALAILLGGDATDTAFFANRAKLERLTGRYSSLRDTLTVDVTREGGHLHLQSDGRPPVSGPLIPETSDPEDLRFYTITASGTEKSVEFVEREDGLSLLYARWRLRKTA
jgi:CubicO group peptidase (beta-lactamase class C family)